MTKENCPRFVFLVEEHTCRCLHRHSNTEPLKSRALAVLMLHSQGSPVHTSQYDLSTCILMVSPRNHQLFQEKQNICTWPQYLSDYTCCSLFCHVVGVVSTRAREIKNSSHLFTTCSHVLSLQCRHKQISLISFTPSPNLSIALKSKRRLSQTTLDSASKANSSPCNSWLLGMIRMAVLYY